MERSPLARLPEQRAAILRRLQGQPGTDPDLHLRAVLRLTSRLETWWQGPVPPRTPYAVNSPRRLPTILAHDPVELLIVRAIAAAEGISEFGVTSDGSVFVTVDGGWNSDSKLLYVNNLSPLLDEVTNIFHHRVGNMGGRFCEHDGRFSTSAWGDPTKLAGGQLPVAAVAAELGRPFALTRPNDVGLLQKLRFRAESLIDTRPYDPPLRPAPTNAKRRTSEEVLVVSFDDALDWPQVGVLGAMGYRVGRKGLKPTDRRAILRRAFNVELRAASGAERGYVGKWGPSRSAARKEMMRKSLRGFIKLAQLQQRADKSEAIEDWESDLRWMGRTFGLRLSR